MRTTTLLPSIRPTRSAADPGTSLFVLSDPKFRLVSRAKRLMKKTAHAEYPHSKTRHMISNVKLDEGDANERKVRANFAVFRTKGDNTVQYMGEAHYVLKLVDGQDSDPPQALRARSEYAGRPGPTNHHSLTEVPT